MFVTLPNFLYNYSGEKKFFNSISVGDLYQYLNYFGYIADDGLIAIPGRIKRFGKDSEDFLIFIEKSSVPITGQAVRQISHKIARLLKINFRVKPKQRITKKYITSSAIIKKIIKNEIKKPEPSILVKAIEPLLERYKIGSIFYRRYRCGVIHGFKVELNESDFFKKKHPYHGVFENIEEQFFQIEFPAIYLKNLLKKSLETYIYKLKKTKKLPIDLFNEMYTYEDILDGNVLEYLDEETIDDFEEVSWQLKNR